MRITRVYTRAGDQGSTRLVGGQSVPKDDPRIEAYGTVDELNAVVGLARTFNQRSTAAVSDVQRIDDMLRVVQNELFHVGGDLATRPADRWDGLHRVGDAETTRLETWCDQLNEDLGPLEEFILPGGGPVGAFLHQARTVCRRAERCLCALLRSVETEESESAAADVAGGCLRYLNRLSDYLFVLGRWAARALGEPEFLWDRPKPGAADAADTPDAADAADAGSS